MTTMEVLPSMTTMEVLAAFRYLVNAEIRKKIGDEATTFREGCQDGYIASMADRYGSTSEEEAEMAYNNKETWTHVTHQIVEDHLSDWADTFENLEDINDLDIDAFYEAIRSSVADFALRNPRKLHNALKHL